MPEKTAIYLRISLDQTGEGLAIERQREDCLRLAEYRQWEVHDIYEDTVSASKRKVRRPSYDRMLADFEGGHFTHVVCYDLDRLTRQPRQLEDWIDMAEDRGLTVVTANGEADLGTDDGRLFARMKAAVARSEVERKSARQKRAAIQRAEKGRTPGGVRLTGYQMGGTVIAEEAAIVQGIFEQFLAGVPLMRIAANLNTAGTPAREAPAGTAAQRELTRGVAGTWKASTVRGILTNPRYAGRAVHRGKTLGIQGEWEPIIAEPAFDLVQLKLSDPARRTNQHGTDRKYLGSGLYRCAVCGDAVTIRGVSYWCAAGQHVTRSTPRVDEYVAAVIAARMRRPDVVAAFRVSDDLASNRMTREIETQRTRLATLDRAFLDETEDDPDFLRLMRQKRGAVKDQLAALERDRARLVAGAGVAAMLGAADPGAAFTAADLHAQRAAIDALCEVRLHRGVRGSKVFRDETVEFNWHQPGQGQ